MFSKSPGALIAGLTYYMRLVFRKGPFIIPILHHVKNDVHVLIFFDKHAVQYNCNKPIMVKKKIDNRIRVMIENGVKLNHRSMFIIIGDKAKDQVN